MTPGRAWMPVSPAVLRARHPKPALSVVGSPTSEAAARAIEPLRADKAEVVYQAIAGQGMAGMTAQEVSEATGIGGDTVRPRLLELWEAQRIVKTTRTRPTRSGKQAQIWVAR